jgi:hypothetical protein
MRAIILLMTLQTAAAPALSVASAASRFAPRVMWQDKSVITAEFTCDGRHAQAILGTTATQIVVAVFVNGLDQKPEVLEYSTQMRSPATARMTAESLDYKSKSPETPDLRKFHFPSTCRGLRLDDGRAAAAHIFWNPELKAFADWVP